MGKFLKGVNVDDPVLNRYLDTIRDAINGLFKNPTQDYVILKDVAVINGTTPVAHKLGRPAVGYFVVKSNASVNVWDSQIDDRYIQLVANATATIDLYVF